MQLEFILVFFAVEILVMVLVCNLGLIGLTLKQGLIVFIIQLKLIFCL